MRGLDQAVQLGAGQDRYDARQRPRLFDVDALDPRVGRSAPHEYGVEHVRELQIVDVGAGAADEAADLKPTGWRADLVRAVAAVVSVVVRHQPAFP
jgi:hypothetical protein